MNAFTLFRLLRRNNNLGFRRSPAYEQSLVAKVLMGIGACFFVLYLIIYGTMFGSIASSEQEPGFLIAIFPILMLVDFGLRFMVQQTPAMLVKPYMLLPVPRKSVIDTFLVTSLLSIYNFLWLSLLLPYFIIILAGGCEWAEACLLLCSGISLIMLNSQFYLVVRTLVARNLFWWLMPIIIYGSYFIPLLIDHKGDLFGDMLNVATEWGVSAWMTLALLALLTCLFLVNRSMQDAFVYEEVSRQEKESTVKVGTSSQFLFFNRFGETGEYLKLELKSVFRNKAIRARVISSLVLIIVFSALIAYTNLYDGRMMLNFFCYYCFSLYGMTALVKIMGPEGNYIDLLMVHRENILTLLRAKYYFHCAVLVVPLLVMLPAVIEGKFSILMMLSYMLLSSGLLYFILFQLAVSNKQTLPLDQKLTGKAQVENGHQLIFELVGMTLPLILVMLLLLVFEEETCYVILLAIGIALTALHPLWLRHVYVRMMKRKYKNLEGFHSSR